MTILMMTQIKETLNMFMGSIITLVILIFRS